MKTRKDVIEIFLNPGEFFFGDEDTRIRTVLGSCVAITMWHPLRKIGGMAHYLLPSRYAHPADNALDGRYADEAMRLFLIEIRRAHLHPSEFEVKLFGGGSMFSEYERPDGERRTAHMLDVPAKNVTAGRELVQRHGFKLIAEHLGGAGHRNVIFDVWSGDVWIRHRAIKEGSGG